MKKIYTLAVAALLSSVAFAQFSNDVTLKNKQLNRNISIKAKTTNKNSLSKTSSVLSAWVNYANDYATTTGATPVGSANYLFPDSTVLVDFGGTPGNPFVHEIGNIFDPKSPYFQAKLSANNASSLTLDSMSIEYFYERKTTSTDADTLLVYLYTNATAANMPTYYFPNSSANYGIDTVFFKGMGYTYTSNKPSATGLILKKILLTAADSSAAGTMKDFLVNLTIPAGKLVGCGITFKPAYTYTAGDNISATKNVFGFVSYEENGTSTFPTYIETHRPSYTTADWNTSHIIPSSVRYNINTNWNGLFIPKWAYGIAYGFESHGIWYKITNTNVGINELENTSASLGQNIPNPYTTESSVTYQLNKEANSVSFTVTDIMGRVISSEKVASSTGKHTVKLGSYSAGVYYYTLTVDGKSATKKMIVQ